MTKRLAKLLAFLRKHALAGEVMPSFEEMQLHMGCRSKSSVHRFLEKLEEAGAITRRHNHARAITVMGVDDFERGIREGRELERADQSAGEPQGRAA